MIIGIDQSFTSTALVCSSAKGIVAHSVISSNKEDDIYTRAAHIAREVMLFVGKHKPSKVILEGLAFGSVGDATRNLAGLQMLIVCELRANGYTVEIVPPTTLKKFGAGKGNATKVEMYDAIPTTSQSILSVYKKTKGRYDIADAYWLSNYKNHS